MNFSAWETINDAINAGYKYWSVYDATGKRPLFKNELDETPEASAERLKLILSRESGEYVQIRLNQKTGEDVNRGGAIRGFTYYFRLNNPAPMLGSSPAQMTSPGGVPLEQYVSAIEKANNERLERIKLELTQNQAPSLLERVATPENVNRFFDLAGALVNSMSKNQNKAGEIAAPPDLDAETFEAVKTLVNFPDGKQALVNIAAAGPVVWAVIRDGLKQNNLLP
jgi:hypothetical protein